MLPALPKYDMVDKLLLTFVKDSLKITGKVWSLPSMYLTRDKLGEPPTRRLTDLMVSFADAYEKAVPADELTTITCFTVVNAKPELRKCAPSSHMSDERPTVVLKFFESTEKKGDDAELTSFGEGDGVMIIDLRLFCSCVDIRRIREWKVSSTSAKPLLDKSTRVMLDSLDTLSTEPATAELLDFADDAVGVDAIVPVAQAAPTLVSRGQDLLRLCTRQVELQTRTEGAV